jgi:predicted ABC-type ATPase
MELEDALALVDAHLTDLFNLIAPTQPVTALETLRTQFRKEVETFPSRPTQEAFAKVVQLKEQLIELAKRTPGYDRSSLAFNELHAEIQSGLQTVRETIISLMAGPAEKAPIGFK